MSDDYTPQDTHKRDALLIAKHIWDMEEGNIEDVAYAIAHYFDQIAKGVDETTAFNAAICYGEQRIADRVELWKAQRGLRSKKRKTVEPQAREE